MMDIDKTLRQRAFGPQSANFAERIIAAALRRPQQPPFTLGAWLVWLCRECKVPKPAFAFSLALCIGIMAGFIAPLNGDADTDNIDAQAFLYEDEEIL